MSPHEIKILKLLVFHKKLPDKNYNSKTPLKTLYKMFNLS